MERGPSVPIAAYFVLVYAVTVVGLVVLGAPSLQTGSQPNPLSLVLFPIMVIWVAVVGVVLTTITTGKPGLRDLRARMGRCRVDLRWYAAAILIPPASILLVLTILSLFVSAAFQPNLLLFGLAFGLVAGFFEEIGWTGYAYPRLRSSLGAWVGAIVLGVLWGVWHLPVVDALGVASPHGPAWPWFFGAFVAVLTGRAFRGHLVMASWSWPCGAS